MMFNDYLILKIVMIVVVIALLFVVFYYTLKVIKWIVIGSKEKVALENLDYHFEQLENKKREMNQNLQRVADIKEELAILEKRYESGIFVKKNEETWNAVRILYLDLSKLKNGDKWEEEKKFFLEEIEDVLSKAFGVEVIKPKIRDFVDLETMKIIETVPGSDNNRIVEVTSVGFKRTLKNGIIKIEQPANVKVSKVNRGE